MAAALKQQPRTDRGLGHRARPSPRGLGRRLREAARQQYLKLADLDAEIVRAFDDAYQRAWPAAARAGA